jgi:hypothetical protein
LAKWIDIMPDETFPNVNLVESILSCIDNLQMEDIEQNKELVTKI